MRLNRIAMIALPVAGLIVGLALSAQAQPKPEPKALKIAFANPAKILEQMKERGDAMKAMERKISQLRTQEEEYKKVLDKMQYDYRQLDPTSEAAKKLYDELIKKQIEVKMWGESSNVALQRDQKIKMMDLYKKIREAVEKVALQEGYDVVFTQNDPEVPTNFMDMDVNALRGMILSKNPIYLSKTANDLSDKIVVRLDSEYMAGPPK